MYASSFYDKVQQHGAVQWLQASTEKSLEPK